MSDATDERGDDERAAPSVPTGQIEDQPVGRPRPEMTAEQMRQYLTDVGDRLAVKGITGEIVLAGGAVMVMALNVRGGSRDIDAVFTREADAIREAAREVAEANGLPAVWLNDHVREFVAPDAPTVEFFEVPGLRIRMVRLDYLFYMKAWAGDPIDQRDLRAIAEALELTDEHQAHDIVRGYSRGELTREIQILLESLFE